MKRRSDVVSLNVLEALWGCGTGSSRLRDGSGRVEVGAAGDQCSDPRSQFGLLFRLSSLPIKL